MTRLDELYAERRRIAHLIRVAEAEAVLEAIHRRRSDSGIALTAAADLYGVEVESILSDDRGPLAVRARHAVCWLLRERGMSFPEIGKVIGRDHTTVMYACRRVDSRPAVRALLAPLVREAA
jgi:chromosomal replication initiation ATPase DnaA